MPQPIAIPPGHKRPGARLEGIPSYLTEQTRRNAYILESLHQAAPMLKNFAISSGQEYDELMQIAALAALEQYDKAQEVANPRAYLHRVIRNAILSTLQQAIPTVSIDESAEEDSDTTYADLLVYPDPVYRDEKREDRQTAVLYAALSRLPLEEQSYLCRVYKVSAYTPTPPSEGKFAGKHHQGTRTRSAIGARAYYWLRRDKLLYQGICKQGTKGEDQ